MRALLLAGLALLRLCGAPSDSARTMCLRSGACYSAHRARLDFAGAREACARHGGWLSSAQGRTEVRAVLGLLRAVAAAQAARPSRFWLGLVRKPQRCTRADLPLRSFSWDDPAAEPPEAPASDSSSEAPSTETPAWLREPSKSCVTQRCAGLQVPAVGEPGARPWGLVESACGSPSPGYVCKYRYDGACVALLPLGAGSLLYALPYGVHSPGLEFSAPGTVLSLRCRPREARFTCRPAPDGGYHWAGEEEHGGLCSCPSGLWSPGAGDCVEKAEDCVGAAGGAFLCLCAWEARLAADEESCLRAPGGAAPLPTRAASPPGRNRSLAEERSPSGAANSSAPAAEDASARRGASTHVFILVAVAVVMLVTLVLAALQAFQVCCRRRAAKGAPSAPVAAPEASATRPDSERALGPDGTDSAEASPEASRPAAESGLEPTSALHGEEQERPLRGGL